MIYNEAITRKSFNEMLKFVKFANGINEVPLLFGGWAVYQYNPYAGSKDVDFIVNDSKFDECVDFLITEGYSLTGLRLSKEGIFFDLYKKNESIENAGVVLDFNLLYENAERVFLRGTHYEVLLPSITNLFLSKTYALVSRNVPKDQSDLIALLVKFSEEDFEDVKSKLDEKTKKKLEFLINKRDIFSLVVKPTKRNINKINSKLKKILE